MVKDSFYVDDLLGSVANDDTAIKLRQEVQELLHEGSFHLRKWRSKSVAVLESIPKEDRAQNAMMCLEQKTDSPASTVKALGVAWDASSDTFTFSYQPPDIPQLTKHKVLSKMASVFDPRGQISPFTIRARVAFQELCMTGIGWDELLPPEHDSKWRRWFTELPELSKVQASRCFKDPHQNSSDAQLQLHTFVDANQHVTAAVTDIRAEYPNGHVRVTMAFAWAKTAPQKITIPKMELKAAVLGVRAASVVGDTLKIENGARFFWSDSMNVIYWTRLHPKNFTSDVAIKIGEIQSSTRGTQWRHVPGTQNPADKGTRGLSGSAMATDQRWWNGPEFLAREHQHWPETVIATCRELPGQLKKVQASTFFASYDMPALSANKFSTWKKLVRISALCRKFIKTLRTRVNVKRGHADLQKEDSRVEGELSTTDIACEERFWVRTAQEEVFTSAMQQLQENKTLGVSDSLYRLKPRLDKSAEPPVLVMGSRLQHNQHLKESVRQPMILPKRHRVTQLLIAQEDELCRHSAGPHHLLSNLRQRFWIVDGLAVVKAVRANCIIRKKLWARPAQQLMGPLPSYRTATSLKPFSRVGVDFAGPFETKQGRGKVRTKRYKCLFTCLEVRACHLEMAYGPNTDAFMMAFSRFTKRRGVHTLVVSDNGTNFTSTEKELRAAVRDLDKHRIKQAFVNQHVEWRFNPARALHFGGVFEAMIKAAKRAIVHTIRNSVPTDEELQTSFVEAENLLNTRPVTAISADPDDLQPLTPLHFLVGRIDAVLPVEICADAETTPHPR